MEDKPRKNGKVYQKSVTPDMQVKNIYQYPWEGTEELKLLQSIMQWYKI